MRFLVVLSSLSFLLASVPMATAAPGSAAPALIHVALPAAATLTIDGAKTTSTSAERQFVTPALEPGKTYHSTFKAQFVRDGIMVTVERQIKLHAGDDIRISMDVPVSPNAIERSYYNGSVPAPAAAAPAALPVAQPVLPVIRDSAYNSYDTGG